MAISQDYYVFASAVGKFATFFCEIATTSVRTGLAMTNVLVLRKLPTLSLRRAKRRCNLKSYQSSVKSFHSGFIVAINASFRFLDQLLICFSRSIAALTSVVVSK